MGKRGERALLECLRSLRVTQGRLAGHRLMVLPWQKRFLRLAVGSPGDSALSVARGNGKSTFVALEDRKEWKVWSNYAMARILHIPSSASVRCTHSVQVW